MEPRKKRKLDEHPGLCIIHTNDVISDDFTYIRQKNPNNVLIVSRK